MNRQITELRAPGAAISASLCFGLGNLAYRYGDGNALAIAGQRCLVGVLFMGPIAFRALSTDDLRRALRDRDAIVSVVVSAVNLVVTAVMLRSLTGPQAALAIATTPLFLLAVRKRFVQHRAVPGVPFAVCVAASCIATLSGGLGAVTPPRIAIVLLFVIVNATDVLCTERARRRHSAALLVAASMTMGTLLGYAAVLVVHPGNGLSTTGYVAASIVGLTGTLGRWLRGYALPLVGSVVVSSTAQISALVTAIGGILLLNDQVRWFAVLLSLLAAGSAFVAVLTSSRTGA